MAKKIDPKAKAKKQKIYAAVGGVLLLGLLAFQVPRTMKMLHPPNVDSAASDCSRFDYPDERPDRGPVAERRQRDRRVGFRWLRRARRPRRGTGPAVRAAACFRPLSHQGPLYAAAQAAVRLDRRRRRCRVREGRAGYQHSAREDADLRQVAQRPYRHGASDCRRAHDGGHPGQRQVRECPSGRSVPGTDPAFTLVSVTAATAKVGIAGGSFENGSQTVKLKKNKPLTLMNTADGTRYVLRFVSVS